MERIGYVLGRLRHSFWALPLLGCALGILLAILARYLDSANALTEQRGWLAFVHISTASGRALFAMIAGAIATMISLTYSLTLVVFTLAAGNLAPRLMESFSDNRVNQGTIAFLGGTFCYALLSFYLTSQTDEPRIAALIGMVLAVISIGTVIFFVHDVANRLLVDNEIARAAEKLRLSIREAFGEKADSGGDDFRPNRDAATPLHARRSGYVQSIAEEPLIERAAKENAFLELTAAPGDFIIPGIEIARLYGTSEDPKSWEAAMDAALVAGPTRTSNRDVLFSAHLLVEIAIRALSPGINDSFTAIRCVDQLSAALSEAVRAYPRSPIRMDGADQPRLHATGVDVATLLDAAFSAICRNAEGNELVIAELHKAFARLEAVAVPENKAILRRFAQRIGNGRDA